MPGRGPRSSATTTSRSTERCHDPPLRRPFDLPRERRAERSAGLRAEDRVLHPREHLRADRAVLSRPEEGGPARWRRLGSGDGPAVARTTARTWMRPTTSTARWTRRWATTKRSIAIDEVPLEWCFQPGVKLDFRHLPTATWSRRKRSQASSTRIGHALKPLEIVVVNTRAGSRYGHDDYVSSGCGMGYEATMYLLERGVRLTGTDAWSWDAPFVHTAKKYGETQRRLADLGRPQGRPRHRLLPPREAAQPRGAAGRRLLHQLLPAQDPRRLGRLDARGRDLRRRADGQAPEDAMIELNHTHDAGGAQLARLGQRGRQRLPDPEPAVRGVPPRAAAARRFAAASRSATRSSTSAALNAAGALRGLAAQAARACAQPALNDFFALGPAAWQALRHGAVRAARGERNASIDALRTLPRAAGRRRVHACPRASATTPTSTPRIHHALNIGTLFGTERRGAELSSHADRVPRPRVQRRRQRHSRCAGRCGQSKAPGASAPTLRPLRVARLRARARHLRRHGQRARRARCRCATPSQHLFGICLLNDWSARDIQGWEMQPLGPFLAKNFATTISPWIVTMEALAPYRLAWQRAAPAPQPLALPRRRGEPRAWRDRHPARGGLETPSRARRRHAARRGSRARASATSTGRVAQMLAHHTVGGCNLQRGRSARQRHDLGPDPAKPAR